MQTSQLSLVFSLLLTLCLLNTTQAQQAGRIESMKLLTPDVGWAATNKKLFWTTDGGAQWKDISPRTKSDRVITSAFFLDVSHGWALLAHAGKEDPQTGVSETLFELASTGDAGGAWSVKPLEIPDPEPSRSLSGETWFDFADAAHGWILVRVNGNTAMSGGVLRATEDGGATWRTLGVPAAGPIRFITPTDGWLDGGANGEAGPGLYVTRDGGRDWTSIAIKAPPELGAKTSPTYRLPQFSDKDSGSMLVTFSQPNDESPKLVLFTTRDGGHTWSQRGSAEEGGTSWQTTYAGAEWMAFGCPSREFATLRSVGEKVSESRVPKGESEAICGGVGGGVGQVSFVDRTRGWALLFAGELVATSDAGQSWRRITPPGTAVAGVVLRKSVEIPTQTNRTSGASLQPDPNASSSSVSTHLGFDRFPVIPKTSDMQTWMNSSPFYDVGIYLPGSKNKSADANLTPAWISAVQGKQGWGIMPIWFGVQSACSCHVNSAGQCVAFTYQINANATQARAQGVSEAKAAISSAQTLGLSPTVIYKDIENYTPDGSTCSLPVQAFLNGWDQQMQTVGKAGVYGNPLPATQDFAKASPVPDDVWIAKYPGTGNPPQLTIWGLGKLTDSPNWTNSQRIHQVQQNVAQNWSSTSYKVDPDIENAAVVNANAVAKSYSYGESNIDCTNLGAVYTGPLAINNMSGGVLINGPGQVGTIVGYFADANTDHGFQNSGGVCSSIDVLGAVGTLATGINNLGQIVGYWSDGSTTHGFFQKPGAAPVTVDYQGAIGGTQLLGVNDAGQIIGVATLSGLQSQAFLYYGSMFYPIGTSSDPGYLIANGINGDATVAGNFPNNFEDSLLPTSWSGTPILISPAPVAAVNAIDSNDDVVGYGYESAACANSSEFCGFLWIGNAALTVLTWPNSSFSYPYGINDFGQIVGEYVDLAGLQHGGLWVPQ